MFNPVGGYASYVVPGVLPIVLQQTLLIGLGMLGGTRRERWLQAPPERRAPRGESLLAVLLGRSAAYFTIYLPYPIFYAGVVFHVYDLPSRGDFGVLTLFTIPYVLAVVLLGQAINALLTEREHAITLVVGTSIPFVFFAGFAWPIEGLPVWLRNLSLLIPSSSGAAGFLRINQMGAGLHDVYFEWCVLWGLCALYFVLAYLGMCATGTMRLRKLESAS